MGNRNLLAAYNRLMASHLGYAVFGRALPAALFALILGIKAPGLRDVLAASTAGLQGWEILTHHTRILYHAVSLVFLVTVCLLFVIRQPVARGLASFRSALVAIAGTFGATPLFFFPFTTAHAALIFSGVCLMVLGTALALLALLHLGRCFGVSPQARSLITAGPYRWVRHPIYLGEEIAALGVLLPVLSPMTLAIFLFHCWLQLARAVSEEAVLAAAFPQYATYKRRVARFMPGLY